MRDRRLIEETFPVKEVSAESAKEKSIRHGYISTLHIWWARRPLASSRATNYAALVRAPSSEDELNRLRHFIIDMCTWKNSKNHKLIDSAKEDILKCNGGRPPRVLDPFAGGGSIPIEALRLGCEVYSGDYNPVAVLIQKCTLEYAQKYGHKRGEKSDWAGLTATSDKNPLLRDVRRWGKRVLEQVQEELAEFFPGDPDGSIPIAYMWARTIPCQNPSCKADVPLMRQFWLAKKSKKGVALFPHVVDGQVEFKVVGDGYGGWPKDFDPQKATVSRAIATCLACGTVIKADTTRRLFQEGNSGERMIAVVSHHPDKGGKAYRVATKEDLLVFQRSEKRLDSTRSKLREKWGLDPVPDEPTPIGKGRGAERAFSVQNYGLMNWGDLFNSRQKLALLTFSERIRLAYDSMREEGYEEEYAKAVTTYLALGLDRLADFGSSLCVLNPTGGRGVVHTFGRQTLQMVWDYAESNPLNPFGAGWPTACEKNEKWISHASESSSVPATVFQGSATSLAYEDDFFDAVFTDPPYYDNVPYSYLSDFFYVWLKRIVGGLHPELFSTPLSPKANEVVAYSNRTGGWAAGKQFFEDMLRKSFQEINRVLKTNGMATIIYAHKSTQGWETLINSLLDSGLVVSGAWPINTEMRGRLRSQESAALASSVYIVARKMARQSTGFYNEVREELKRHLAGRLDSLWKEGISGADFFISAIGSAIEVFGKYEKVMDYEGSIVRADKLLEDLRVVVTDYAVRQILHNGFGGEISDLTRLYVLWRWEFAEAKVPFDEARKLAQSSGIDLSKEWNRNGFIRKEKEFIWLKGPQDRDHAGLENSHELIDVLHFALQSWEKGKRDEMARVLSESGFGRTEAFFRVAQAISETLPNESKEKKLLDGFLAGRGRLHEEIKKRAAQTRLIE